MTGSTSELKCPTCEKKFTEIKSLPDLLKDPRSWFQLCDADLGGSLDKKEVLDALGAVLPIERDKLRRAIEGNWHVWDRDGDGDIGMSEFLREKTGMKDFIIKNFKQLAEAVSPQSSDIPDLDSQPKEWFEYWDEDRSGELQRDELVRAMVRTFCVTPWGQPLFQQARNMKEVATIIWDDLGYKRDHKLSYQEFVKSYGLADQIYHNCINGMFVGEDDQ